MSPLQQQGAIRGAVHSGGLEASKRRVICQTALADRLRRICNVPMLINRRGVCLVHLGMITLVEGHGVLEARIPDAGKLMASTSTEKIVEDMLAEVDSEASTDAILQATRLNILVNKKLLKEELKPDVVLERLVGDGVFSDEEEASFLKVKKTQDRTQWIISAITKKDMLALEQFTVALRETGHHRIAECIENTQTDETGQIRHEVTFTIRILEEGDVLKDVPGPLRKTFHKESSCVRSMQKSYGLLMARNPRPGAPLTMVFDKADSFNPALLKEDLLSRKLAATIKTYLYDDDYTGPNIVVLDVDLNDLKQAVKRRHPSSDSGFDDCDCDGDGACIKAILQNKEDGRHHDEPRTMSWHQKALDMITRHVLKDGKKCYNFKAEEIRKNILQHRERISLSIIRTRSELNILHQTVIEGRTDVLQVLFECGIIRELAACPVRQQGSPLLDKTCAQIASTMSSQVGLGDAVHKLLKQDQDLPWLHCCARANDVDSARMLLERHPALSQVVDSERRTALFWAITGGYRDMVRLILDATDNDPLLITQSEGSKSALGLACAVGRSDLVSLLIDYGADPNGVGEDGLRPIEHAIAAKDVAAAKVLVQVGAEPPADALCQAAKVGDVRLCDFLLENTTDVDCHDSTGMTPLLHAVRGGYIRLITKLVEEGADIRAKDKQHRNIFHMAVESGQKTITQRLIQLTRNKGIIRELVNAQDRYIGQDRCYVVRGRDNGEPAFHYVEVERWLTSAFKAITHSGGTVDVAKYGTAFLSGWGVNPSSAVQKKVEARYNVNQVNAQTPKDLTPLNFAILKDQIDCADIILQALVEENLSLCVADCFQMQPIHTAAMRGKLDLVRTLESHGVPTDSTIGTDLSVADIADQNNHIAIVNFIQGKDVMSCDHLTEFMRRLDQAKEALSQDCLERIRQTGESVKRHAIDNVRLLDDALKDYLYTTGSSAIQTETSSGFGV